MEIELTNLALASIEDIALYVRLNFSDNISRKAIDGIKDAIARRAIFPESGQPFPGMEEFGNVRYWTYKQNQIIYRLLPNRLQILIVWDGRQDPEKLLDLMLDYFLKTISEDK